MKAQIKADPSLVKREPYQSVASKDLGYFNDLYENAVYDSLVSQLLGVPFGGLTKEQFEDWAD